MQIITVDGVNTTMEQDRATGKWYWSFLDTRTTPRKPYSGDAPSKDAAVAAIRQILSKRGNGMKRINQSAWAGLAQKLLRVNAIPSSTIKTPGWEINVYQDARGGFNWEAMPVPGTGTQKFGARSSNRNYPSTRDAEQDALRIVKALK